MNCLKFLVKHLLFIVNLIFVLVALAIIGIGSYLLHYVNNNDVLSDVIGVGDVTIVHDFNADILRYVCIAIIVLGCVIFLISFCGCCGSITENKCLLILYALVMLVLAGGSVYLIITRNTHLGRAESWVEDNLYDIFHTPQFPIEDETINGIQYTVKCCGYNGPEFYDNATLNVDENILNEIYDKLNITGIGLVSPSCCSTIDLDAFLNDPQDYVLNEFRCTSDDLYTEGCKPRVFSYVDAVVKYITIGYAILAGVTIAAFLFGTYLVCAIKPKRPKHYQRY